MPDQDQPAARKSRRPAPRQGLKALTDELMDELDPTHGADWDERPTLYPGTDYKDGVLYITLPIARNEDKIVGKGRAAHTVTEKNMRTMCFTSEGDAFWYDKDTVMRMGFAFPNTMTQETESRWPLESVRAFREGSAPNIDPKDLWQDIHDAVFDHVDYADDIFYDITAYYILISYVFRIFESIGYLHFTGTMGTGKSQNLRLLSAAGFNAVWASNMSGASLYRQAAGCPGIICLDEVESFEGERGQEIRQLLNAGYTNPGWATRTEKQDNDRYQVIRYSTYTPKALASINPLEPTLASRCLIIPMRPHLRRLKYLSDKDPKWAELRTRLYLWAMQNAPSVDEIHQHWQTESRLETETDLKDRHWEVAMPFIVLADHIGGAIEAKRLIRFFESFFEKQRMAAADSDRQLLLLRCLPRVFDIKDSNDGEHWKVKDIHDVVNEYLNEDQREYYTSNKTSRHLASLGWTDKKSARGGTIFKITEDEVRAQLTTRHVAPFDEDLAWYKNELSYVERDRENRKPDPEHGFNWADSDEPDQ